MKRKLLVFGLGIAILAAVLVVTTLAPLSPTMALISSDARLFYVLGAILLFAGALCLAAKGNADVWDAVLVGLPLIAAFGLTTLPESPFLWPTLPLWLLSAAGGTLIGSFNRYKPASLVLIAVLVLSSLFYCGRYVPKQMEAVASHTVDHASPVFSLQPIDSRPAPLQHTPGKILVIDFAQTWCVPCLAELPQVAEARDELKDRNDIEFVIVATSAGGDTPERLRAFVERQHVTLPLAYDPRGAAHAAFGLHGFPSLVVLDRNGHVRFEHEGYNSSEMDFRHNLVELLRRLG